MERPQLLQLQQVNMNKLKTKVLNFGKFKGQTYQSVFRHQCWYYFYFKNTEKHLTGQLKEFIGYCDWQIEQNEAEYKQLRYYRDYWIIKFKNL